MVLRYNPFAVTFFVANFSIIGLLFPLTVSGLAKYLGLKIIKVGFSCSVISVKWVYKNIKNY
jgi:hypothetical protein